MTASFGTPYVSGVVALMLDANPALTLAQVREILRTTAQDWGPAGQDVDYGWGRLDAHAAVKRAGNFTEGSPPPVPGHVSFAGTLSSGKAEHTFAVSDVSYPLAVTLIMPGWSGSNSPDFDLYVFNPDGSELGRATSTSRQELVSKTVTQTGLYKVEVRAYGGSGEYQVDVSGGLGTASDQPPAVTIVEPAEGATVSGTVTVKVRAVDDNAVSKAELAVDNGPFTDITASFDGTHYSYAWNTSTAANGPHTLTARAADNGARTGSATRSLTVSNQAPEPGLAHELQKTGQVTGAARDANFTINVHERGYFDLSLSWSGRADLDFYVYGPDGAQVGRAYTLNNPERLRVDTTQTGPGAYRVRVNLYGGPDTSFTLTAKGFKAESYQGTVTPSAKDATHQRNMAHTGRGRASLGWQGTSDIDFYLYDQLGRERGKAFTLANPEVLDTPIDATGAWSIRVNLYSGAGGAYTLKWTVPEAILS